MIFTCPRCRRTKDFGATYIPPLGRSYICPCGLNTVVRPTWGADGSKQLVSSGPRDPAPASAKQQQTTAIPVDAVKERLAKERPSATMGAVPPASSADERTEASVDDVTAPAPRAPVADAVMRPPATTPAPSLDITQRRAPPAPVPAPAAPSPDATLRRPLPSAPRAPAPEATTRPPPPAVSPAAPPRPLPRPIPPPEAPKRAPPPPAPNLDATMRSPRPAVAAPPPNPDATLRRPMPSAPPAPPPPIAAPPPPIATTPPIAASPITASSIATPPPPIAAPNAPPRVARRPLGFIEAGVAPAASATLREEDEVTELGDPEDVTAPAPRFSPAPIPVAPPVQEVTEPPVPRRPTPSTAGPIPAPVAEEPSVWQTETTAPGPAVVEPEIGEIAEELEPSSPKPKRRWYVRAAIVFAQILFAVLLFGAGLGYVEYRQMESELPAIDTIKNYRPPIVTEIHDRNGVLVGLYSEEERYVLPFDEIPLQVRRAFLAAEDADFYQHSGVDYKSILRAVLKNAETGKSGQGASTITQQVARTFLLSREKTYKRKIAEMLLSKKIESELSKDEILHRYLNQIFFGHGAYGVEAAARIHFGKHAKELSLAEAALLAGLPQAPSRYSPNAHPEEALRRRAYVLGQMLDNGWITQAEKDAADKEPLALSSMPDPTLVVAPYSVEQVRKDLEKTYGHEMVYRGGLQVTTTIDAKLEQAAQKAVRDGLQVLDHRIGYRGAPGHVEKDKIDATVAALGQDAPALGTKTRGVIDEVTPEHAYVRLAGGALGVLHVADNPWAYPPNPESYFKYRVQTDLGKVLHAGDIVDVETFDPLESAFSQEQAKLAKKKGWKPDAKLAAKLAKRVTLRLVQEPDVQGALLSFHIPDGRVLAMVGGTDFGQSQFIRPIQSHRQAGSTFKTIVYAAALSKLPPEIADPDHVKKKKTLPGAPDPNAPRVWTLASILQDAPLVMTPKEAELTHKAGADKESDEQEMWKPGNYGNKYYGDTPLRTAFVLSRNLPTLQLAQKVGVREVIALARKLGVESDLPPDLSLALGSASLTLLELSRAFAPFASGGVAVQPRFLEKVVDRDGAVKFDLAAELAKAKPIQLIDPRPAFVMTQLLEDVARFGTASKATDLKRPSGGKTGTTNDYVDAWYVGFTPSIVTGVWVGYDQVKSLGVGETGGEAALPIWLEYMKAATAGLPKEDFTPPDGVVKEKIDRKTGLLAYPNEPPEEIVETWFVKGTEPLETARPGKFGDSPNIFQADPGLR